MTVQNIDGNRSCGMTRILAGAIVAAVLGLILALGGGWVHGGSYGIHTLLRHGGTWWIEVKADDPRLSRSIHMALATSPPPTAGDFKWRRIAEGFEVAELPVIAGGSEVDRFSLARVDPARFRFAIRNASAGDKDLDEWMTELGAALVINGSYYSRYGAPDTPLLTAGTLLGLRDYDAKAGAFVASDTSAGIRDLGHEDWRAAFQGASDAMVSYPLLIGEDGQSRVSTHSRWLANRSFVGQDASGWIVLGTTTDAFFSLDRLAEFLRNAPLGLRIALNLDGGPVACQGISLSGFERRVYGKWELQVTDGKVELLTWPYGTVAMPIVLAIFPK
jgi:hypothetical protein